MEGTAGSTGALYRKEGFHSVTDMCPDMKVIASQPADFTRMKGLEVMENFIQRFGDEIDAVYAHSDEIALGAIQALEDSNLSKEKKIWVLSLDGEKQALKAIIDGKLDLCVECPPFYGPEVYEVAKQILNGEKIPTIITIRKQRIFTRENVENYYDPDSVF